MAATSSPLASPLAIRKSMLEAIGNTPVVKLRKLEAREMADVVVKLEYYNPTGSYNAGKPELIPANSTGVAPNKFLANIAWNLEEIGRALDPFLSPLLVGELPGVGKVTEEKLQSFTVQTVGELKSMTWGCSKSVSIVTESAFMNSQVVATKAKCAYRSEEHHFEHRCTDVSYY